MGRDGEGDKKEVKGWKGRGKDLPDQCQTASYAPEDRPLRYTPSNPAHQGLSTNHVNVLPERKIQKHTSYIRRGRVIDTFNVDTIVISSTYEPNRNYVSDSTSFDLLWICRTATSCSLRQINSKLHATISKSYNKSHNLSYNTSTPNRNSGVRHYTRIANRTTNDTLLAAISESSHKITLFVTLHVRRKYTGTECRHDVRLSFYSCQASEQAMQAHICSTAHKCFIRDTQQYKHVQRICGHFFSFF